MQRGYCPGQHAALGGVLLAAMHRIWRRNSSARVGIDWRLIWICGGEKGKIRVSVDPVYGHLSRHLLVLPMLNPWGDTIMRDEVKAAIVTAVLIFAFAIVFKSVLAKPQNVVPLFLVPAFFYFGYVAGQRGFKVWLAGTLAITIALGILYALP